MSITKYEIYDFWKNKVITNNFQIKDYESCKDKEDAVRIIEFSDSICCWACDYPSFILDEDFNGDLKKEWNYDKMLQKSHIIAKSLVGNNSAENMFLLCPDCHAKSPDTSNRDNFFAWVYYKRKHENFVNVFSKELELACKMKKIDINIVLESLSKYDLEKILEIRKKIIKNCTVHGSFMSMSTKMMGLIDEVIKE